MKKKQMSWRCAVALLCVAALSLCACGVDNRPQSEGEIAHGYSACYAFTAREDVMSIGANTSMKDYLDALKADGRIVFEGTDGEYGYYLTSVLGLSGRTVSSTANSYAGYDWAVYTTLTSMDDVVYSSDDSTFTYNGVTMYKAAYGVSGIPCIKGESYALVYEYSSMSW